MDRRLYRVLLRRIRGGAGDSHFYLYRGRIGVTSFPLARFDSVADSGPRRRRRLRIEIRRGECAEPRLLSGQFRQRLVERNIRPIGLVATEVASSSKILPTGRLVLISRIRR